MRAARGDAAARRAHEQPLLDEVGLADVLERVALLGAGGGERLDADGPAVELLDDRAQERAVELVEAELVDAEPGERRRRRSAA